MQNKKLWFKAKQYGWGWQPATWEGWVTLLVYLAVIFSVHYFLLKQFPTGKEAGQLPVKILLTVDFVMTAVLIFVCYKKGERPSWRWGNKK